jgi:uncharacterized membrane protein YidH (DUF202 family)
MKKTSPDFDGIVTGDVAAASANEIGSVTVAMRLSDGVTGAMKLIGTARVKIAEKQPQMDEAYPNPGVPIALATAALMLFLCLMALLLRFLP